MQGDMLGSQPIEFAALRNFRKEVTKFFAPQAVKSDEHGLQPPLAGRVRLATPTDDCLLTRAGVNFEEFQVRLERPPSDSRPSSDSSGLARVTR